MNLRALAGWSGLFPPLILLIASLAMLIAPGMWLPPVSGALGSLGAARPIARSQRSWY
jgi:hypothetical protein